MRGAIAADTSDRTEFAIFFLPHNGKDSVMDSLNSSKYDLKSFSVNVETGCSFLDMVK